MASIPKGILCPTCKKIADSINKINGIVKRKIMLYAFAFVLIIEILSLTVLRDTISNNCNPFWYVLLTQLVLFVIFLNLNYNRILLKFCKRQIVITRCLFVYYFIGIISLVFNISDANYIVSAKWLLIGVSVIALILTITNHKKSK